MKERLCGHLTKNRYCPTMPTGRILRCTNCTVSLKAQRNVQEDFCNYIRQNNGKDESQHCLKLHHVLLNFPSNHCNMQIGAMIQGGKKVTSQLPETQKPNQKTNILSKGSTRSFNTEIYNAETFRRLID